MKLLLLGASGRTGKLVLQNALRNGYQVNCLARKSGRIENQNGLNIYEGNPTNKADLENALSGCDGVISVLDISRKSEFPWSGLRTPKKFLSNTVSLLIPLMKNQDIRRISICSAWGVNETKNDIPIWFKWFVDHSNIGAAYRDHERQENILMKSNLDWTIIRPVGLTNSKKEEKIMVTVDDHPKPNFFISRQSVARYLVESMEKAELINKKVVISKE